LIELYYPDISQKNKNNNPLIDKANKTKPNHKNNREKRLRFRNTNRKIIFNKYQTKGSAPMKKTCSQWVRLGLITLMLFVALPAGIAAAQEPDDGSFTLICQDISGSGIEAVVPYGVLPTGAVLGLTGGASITPTPGYGWPISSARRIAFFYNDEEIQPNGYFTLRLPIPETFTGDHSMLWVKRIDREASERLEANAVDGFMVFETNSTGLFVIWLPPNDFLPITTTQSITTESMSTITTTETMIDSTTIEDSSTTEPNTELTEKNSSLPNLTMPPGHGTPPPQTGVNFNTSAAIAVIILVAGGIYCAVKAKTKD